LPLEHIPLNPHRLDAARIIRLGAVHRFFQSGFTGVWGLEVFKSANDMWKSFAFFLAGGCLLFPYSAHAWGGAGHQLIAAEAYRQLSPELKAETFAVLQSHPDFAQWTNAYHPNPSFDLAAYVFMRCSTWPDEIRGSGGQYDHPEWHFIDYPLRPPNFVFEPDARPTNNVLFGIAESKKALSNTNAEPEVRAAMLSYLIHLVGDEHQPLHCESFFDATYTNGDRGGNDVYVMPDKMGVRLHGIWDGLLGTAMSPRLQWNYATELLAKYPRTSLPELTAHTTPKEWSLESRELAIDAGYLRGKLKGGTNQDTAPALPADYLKNAKTVAEKQGALAGYRLADEIRTCLKCAGPVPLLPENTFTAAQTHLPEKIGTALAGNYYDETMVVTGKVVAVSERPNITILDVDQTYPNSFFTVVVFAENAGKFGDLQKLTNKSVEISGTITEYRNKPEIILESPAQIKVVDGK
jgi:hypothetical protein